MIAALPMYDRPELRAETDALWGAIRDALRARGIDAPDSLTRGRDPWAIWTDPGLVLAQTCGLPYRSRLHDRVALVATPDYALPGCPPGHYNSVIIARDPCLPDRPRIAVNDPLSQSGWAALHDWTTARGVTRGPVLATGGHAASAHAVARGQADLAAIDAQTWRQILRAGDADPALEIDRTAPTPALPFITAGHRDPAPIRAALAAAVTGLPADLRAALDLAGLVQIAPGTYRAVPVPPNP